MLGRRSAGKREAEAGVDGFRGAEFEPGIYYPGGAAPGTGGGAKVAGSVAQEQVGAGVELRLGAIEGAARNRVDRAGEGQARRFGRGGETDLDAREVDGGDFRHLQVAGGVGLRARLIEAIAGNRQSAGAPLSWIFIASPPTHATERTGTT